MAEGTWPKADGQILYASEANDLADLHSTGIKSRMRDLSTAKIWMDDLEQVFAQAMSSTSLESTSTNLTQFSQSYYADSAVSATYRTTDIAQRNNISTAAVYANYYVNNLLDSFSDSVVSSLWTTSVSAGGTITETGGKLILTCGLDAATTYVRAHYTGKNYYRTTDRVHTHLAYLHVSNSSGDHTFYLKLTDGTTDVTLATEVVDGGADNFYNEYIIKFNGSADTCDLYENGTLSSSDISVSTLASSTWYVKYDVTETTSSNMTTKAEIHFLSDDDISSPSTTFTQRVSADGGSVYDEAAEGNKGIIPLTTPGKTMRVGFNATVAADEVLIVHDIGAAFIE